MVPKRRVTLLEAQENFAKTISNGIWALLEKEGRTPSQDEDLILMAHSSLYHWKQIGTAVNLQQGYWMISHVYQVLGDSKQALAWALKCQQVTEKFPGEMEDFDLAYAHEGLARAYAMTNDLEKAKKQYDLAAGLGEKIKDPDDKQIFLTDFEGGNWYQISPG